MGDGAMSGIDDIYRALLAEVERLKVCGNCGYCSYSADRWWCGAQAPEEVAASDRCRFKPSRWKERES